MATTYVQLGCASVPEGLRILGANGTNDIIASNNVPSTSTRPDWQPTDKQLGLQPGDPTVPTSGRESVPGRNEVPW